MRKPFADSCYWIALLLRSDTLHQKAAQLSKSLGPARIFTSELVLVEVLNFLGGKGPHMRQGAAEFVDDLKNDPNSVVVQLTSIQFSEALERYRTRADKAWSLIDCASFIIMEQYQLTEALSYDKHFEQANFRALLRDNKE